MEATLTSVMVGFGALPQALPILAWSATALVNFWLPIPLGGLAYLSVQVNA